MSEKGTSSLSTNGALLTRAAFAAPLGRLAMAGEITRTHDEDMKGMCIEIPPFINKSDKPMVRITHNGWIQNILIIKVSTSHYQTA